MPYEMVQLQGKLEIKVCLGNRDFDGKNESNRCVHRKTDIIIWSLRSFWVERFDLNQSLNIDFGTKPFLYQCKNSARNRFFPRSRLGQMTYRKLKPHASWPLQMRRGVTPPRCIAIAWGGDTPPGGEKPTAAAACSGYPIILLYRGCLGTCHLLGSPD